MISMKRASVILCLILAFGILTAGNAAAARVVVYEHIDFGGDKLDTKFDKSYVGASWNDKISSIKVKSGTWRFYEHANYEGRYWDLGPGDYSWVEDVGIPNDLISSFKRI